MPEAEAHAGGGARVLAPAPASPSPPSADVLPAPAATTRTAYLPQLDGLRALAVLMVFAHHAYAVPLLWSGVDLFFILSGFLITNILLRDSGRMGFRHMLGHFYLRRAQRILPAYAVCLALIALLVPQNWHAVWPFYAFFLQNVPYAFRLIGFSPLVPLWSLAVEQHFYLVWPFLVFFLPRRWLVPSMLALVLGVPVLRALCTPLFAFSEPIYVLTPFRLDAMAAGALAALVLPHCQPGRATRWAHGAMLAGVLAYALLARYPWFRRDANSAAFNALAYSLNILILGGVFVWTVLADPRSWLVRLLSLRPLRSLGRVSYAFYLLHLLVLVRFGPYFAPHLGPPICFLLTLGLAGLSWVALEKPLLSLGGGHRGASVQPQGSAV